VHEAPNDLIQIDLRCDADVKSGMNSRALTRSRQAYFFVNHYGINAKASDAQYSEAAKG
jgi:hypothetical protein